MTFIPKEAIEVIAQSIGITNLSSDVALAVAPDVEYRIREIMQEAVKCMRHARRTVLRAADVDGALMLRNVEPIYGFGSSDSLRFKRADGLKDLYYIEDKEVEFKDVLAAPLPKAPIETSVTTHWLAIEGVQPAIRENAPVEAPVAVSDGKRSDYREDGLSADIKVPVKPVLSRELQFYFDKIKQLTVNRSNSILFRQALTSLATSSGIQPLVPFFTCFIADEVTRSLTNFPLLFALMRVARSLLQNPHLHIELYLHQMIPSIMTCLVSKRLGNRFSDNHWDLRNFAANMIALICKRFGHAYHNLQSRVTRTLLHAFLDPTKSLPQHYGAIQGLAALGTSVVRLLILPNLEPYLQLLEPEMHFEEQKNKMKRTEAWHVYGALQHAAGLCVYDQLKKFPRLLTLPIRSCLKRNGRVGTISASKRKASMDNLMHQPPLKKMAAGGAMGLMPVNSMSVDMPGPTGGLPNIMGSSVFGGSSVGISTMPRQIPKENMLGREMNSRASKTSTVLAQAWREDMEGGQLLASLVELFGESMFRFTPKSELLLFL